MNPTLSIEELKLDLPRFHQRIKTLISKLGLDLSSYQADHIALRVNEQCLASELHQNWSLHGKVISDKEINGRPIVVIKETQSFSFGEWLVDCVELPYPAAKRYPHQGWEHVEFVVPSDATDADTYLSELLTMFPALADRWDTLASRGVKVKLSSPAGEGERIPNPTVAFKAGDVCIKLHPVSLEDVIASEK
ncbi:VOC family protein [Veronia pacifica]|uniref:VOC family protein n=1 Tax=Veronia pacifica TaxID=1080227 RepID=A0A1C3ERM9_9GAMM|nr:VOC family protein [Veronia pacifica]ODA35848.1 hypothetical protein A8L45_02085 [Veronia pacifica]